MNNHSNIFQTTAATNQTNAQDLLGQQREYLEHQYPDVGDGRFLNVHWKTTRIDPNGVPIWGGHACTSIEEAMTWIAWAQGKIDIKDLFVCTSTQRDCVEKPLRNGGVQRATKRSARGAIGQVSLFLDIDAKGEDKNSYNSVEEALTARDDFLKAIGLQPTMTVNSGGGVHTYIRFDRQLAPEEWKPLAFALAEAGKHHGLKFDAQCTVDVSRILRPPGTFNHKPEYGGARPVQLVGKVIMGGYPVSDIETVLAPYRVEANRAAEPLGKVINFPRRPPLAGVSDLAAGIETNLEEIRSAALAIPPAAIASEGDWMSKLARPLAHTARIFGNQSEQIYEILKESSARTGGGKYDETDNRTRWERYVAEALNLAKPITSATLFGVAKNHGWTGWQPAPIVQMPLTSTTAPVSEAPGTKWSSEEPLPGGGPSFADPYAEFVGPAFPLSVLPPVLTDFVEAQHRAMGADPAAIAMSAIAAAAGAASAETRIQAGSSWEERPIIWVANVGLPSAMKTPVIDKTTKPLRNIDAARDKTWRTAHSAWEQAKNAAKATGSLPGPEPVKPGRAIIDDATSEKAAEILSRDPAGVLMVQDELAGLIDSFERYGNGSAARSFYLRSWNGGVFLKDRVGQGAKDKYAETRVENLAIGIIGGIQPDRLSRLRNLTDDGLLQRFLPVLMRPAERGDERYSVATVEMEYERLIQSINAAGARTYVFAADAEPVRTRVLDRLHALEQGGAFSPEIGGAVGKLKGYFSRLALTLQIAEAHSAVVREGTPHSPNPIVSRKNAEGAERLVFEFLLQHMIGLYDVIVGGSRDRDIIRVIADFILSSSKDRLVPSDFTTGVRKLRGEPATKIAEWASRFIALGWLCAESDVGTVKAWLVMPGLRSFFTERREKAQAGRAAAHQILRSMGRSKHAEG